MIKMAPHFDTYYLSKNIVCGCQNTVQSCKIAFGISFLATPIGVALRIDLIMILIKKRNLITFMNNILKILIFNDYLLYINYGTFLGKVFI